MADTKRTKLGVRPQPLVAVRDVAASGRFYERLLGCESTHGDDSYRRLVWGNTFFMQLHAWDEEDHPNLTNREAAKPGHGVLLWFEVDDFDAAVERARALKPEIVEDVHVNPNSSNREIWLKDPDGYMVVLASDEGERARGYP